jgi:hypothetical protein
MVWSEKLGGPALGLGPRSRFRGVQPARLAGIVRMDLWGWAINAARTP